MGIAGATGEDEGARRYPRLRLLRECVRLTPGASALYALTTVAGAAGQIAVMVTVGNLVGSVPDALDQGLDSAAADAVLRALAWTVGVALLVAVISAAEGLVRDRATAVAHRRYQQELMRAMLAPETLDHLEDPSFIDRYEAARGGGGAAPISAISVVGIVAMRMLTGALAVALVAWFSWWLGVGLALHAIWARRHWQGRYRRISESLVNQTAVHRRSGYIRSLAMTPPAAKDVRVFGLADHIRDRYRSEWQAAMAPVWGRMGDGVRISVAVEVVRSSLIAIGFFLVVDAALAGDITLSVAVIVVQALLATELLSGVTDHDYVLTEGSVRVPYFKDLVAELQATAAASRRRATVTLAPDAPAATVRLDSVTFRYPGTDVDILRGLDLDIEAGSSLAVVGLNGAGKTTLVKVLSGLYTPTAGTIEVDGVDLADVGADAWRRHVAAIWQDFRQYPLPARDNVGFGAPDLLDDTDALDAAVDVAGARSVIESLPRGWDSVLDRRFEGGADLSGGQWQRVALARAMMAVAGGARLLVLDEPTAALDVRAEAEVYERFLDMTRGLTTVIISHRFSTVRRADRIVVLRDGRVVEDGSHDDLVAADGRYAEMFLLQAARYQHASPDAGAGDR